MNTQPINGLNENALSEHGHDHRLARSSGWIGGVILIGAGILLLLQNMHITGYYWHNWWALFILIPAVTAFGKAWDAYQDAGCRPTAQVRSSLIGGIFLCLLSAMFLFSLSWTIFGPAVMMLIGVSLVVNGLLSK